jgi:replication factor C subunit 1
MELIREGCNNMTICLSGAKTLEGKTSRTLLILDDLDGMGSGDRGGISAIIQMIKKTRVPIICICNDSQKQNVRSLASHCYEIKCHKPNKREIVGRLEQVLRNENSKKADVKLLDNFVEMLGCDVRQCLSYLELAFKGDPANLANHLTTHVKLKDNAVITNVFESSKKLMNRTLFSRMTIEQRVDLSFMDDRMMPLMVHENYLSASPKKRMSAR